MQSPIPTDPLYARIYAAVERIPKGSIASYGQVAQAVNLFRGARIVGWALRALPADQTAIPWHRVVNKKAQVSIINPQVSAAQQAELLQQEGHLFHDKDGLLEIEIQNGTLFRKMNLLSGLKAGE